MTNVKTLNCFSPGAIHSDIKLGLIRIVRHHFSLLSSEFHFCGPWLFCRDDQLILKAHSTGTYSHWRFQQFYLQVSYVENYSASNADIPSRAANSLCLLFLYMFLRVHFSVSLALLSFITEVKSSIYYTRLLFQLLAKDLHGCACHCWDEVCNYGIKDQFFFEIKHYKNASTRVDFCSFFFPFQIWTEFG